MEEPQQIAFELYKAAAYDIFHVTKQSNNLENQNAANFFVALEDLHKHFHWFKCGDYAWHNVPVPLCDDCIGCTFVYNLSK